jgi:MFS transporter, DHA2 family, multidrug resistance protein
MTTRLGSPRPARSGRREWAGLAVLALLMLLVSMDLTVLHLVVPSLSADLRPSSSQLLWIADIYGFMIAGCLITMGTLGDRVGRRRLLLIGAAAFGLASVLAAFSTSAEILIAARALLGIAGATLAPSTLALIRNMFHDAAQRTVAISIWFTSFLAGAALGPLVGGALLEFFWWGSAFLIGVPVMVLLLVTGPILLPEYRDRHAGRMDLPSAVLALGAVLGLIYGLKEIAADGPAVIPALAVVAGLVAGVAFARRQHSLADPLIDLRLFGTRTFSISLGALTLGAVAIGGMSYLAAQYLQLVLGLSPLQAGLWMLPPSGVGIVAMLLAPLLARRVRPGFVMAAGLTLAAVGFAVVSQAGGASGLPVVVIGLMIVFAGLMPVSALGVDVVLAAAPPERAGAASAISETAQELGLALGIALLGTIGVAVYRGQMLDVVPAGVAPEVAEAARDTLGGATGVAEQLPPGLLVTAGEAFTDGLQRAAAMSAVALAGMAVVAAIVLRRIRVISVPGREPRSSVCGDVVVGGVVEGADAGSGVVCAPEQAPLQGWRVVEVDVGDVGAGVVAANVGADGEDALSGADERE